LQLHKTDITNRYNEIIIIQKAIQKLQTAQMNIDLLTQYSKISTVTNVVRSVNGSM